MRIALHLASAAVLLSAPAMFAGVIQSPVAATIDAGGPGFGSINNTFDQSGLSAGFTSGVTDFDAYMALNPTHTVAFPGFEWFSNSGTVAATVTYDVGSIVTIARLALWNEESSGIGLLDLRSSTDGVTFSPLALGLTPTDHALINYPADIFAFGPVSARYIRFEMSRCPQPNAASFPGCAIGEVAFDVVGGQVVPEPSTFALLGAGLLATFLTARRRVGR